MPKLTIVNDQRTSSDLGGDGAGFAVDNDVVVVIEAIVARVVLRLHQSVQMLQSLLDGDIARQLPLPQ